MKPHPLKLSRPEGLDCRRLSAAELNEVRFHTNGSVITPRALGGAAAAASSTSAGATVVSGKNENGRN